MVRPRLLSLELRRSRGGVMPSSDDVLLCRFGEAGSESARTPITESVRFRDVAKPGVSPTTPSPSSKMVSSMTVPLPASCPCCPSAWEESDRREGVAGIMLPSLLPLERAPDHGRARPSPGAMGIAISSSFWLLLLLLLLSSSCWEPSAHNDDWDSDWVLWKSPRKCSIKRLGDEKPGNRTSFSGSESGTVLGGSGQESEISISELPLCGLAWDGSGVSPGGGATKAMAKRDNIVYVLLICDGHARQGDDAGSKKARDRCRVGGRARIIVAVVAVVALAVRVFAILAVLGIIVTAIFRAATGIGAAVAVIRTIRVLTIVTLLLALVILLNLVIFRLLAIIFRTVAGERWCRRRGRLRFA
ncbi:hypothetical protein ACRALDRAFT_1079663 [Sodiomyces alcalophilus JCM 7366]|uniref:uncharacterized protein n=1 Tax=Sodiomyces alcalophilus JCM 7366 TaxID=591952 RepID=UPI0039B42981